MHHLPQGFIRWHLVHVVPKSLALCLCRHKPRCSPGEFHDCLPHLARAAQL